MNILLKKYALYVKNAFRDAPLRDLMCSVATLSIVSRSYVMGEGEIPHLTVDNSLFIYVPNHSFWN